MKPPTLEEVAAYCQERGSGIDAEHFHAYYESQGWKKANGRPLTDWKKAVITWEKKQAADNKQQPWAKSWVRVRMQARYVERYRHDPDNYSKASALSKQKLTMLERHVLEVFGGFKRFWSNTKEETLKFDFRDCYMAVTSEE